MKVFIFGESITIGQLLKKQGFITTGGQAKSYLQTHRVTINNKLVKGKNSRVWVGSKVVINGHNYYVLTKINIH